MPHGPTRTGTNHVIWRGKKFVHFSGCDYLRLSAHPKVVRAFHEGLKKHGLSLSASRLTTGNHPLYERLEQRLAAFFDAPSATIVPTGSLANIILAQSLAGEFSHALVDARAHPVLAAAAKHTGCPALPFRHCDPEDLAAQLKKIGPRARPLVMTEGMFWHDGSTAPLTAYLDLLPHAGRILVDDAHGAGVLGRTGRGTLEHAGVGRSRVFQTLTLSKAFGAFGGVILAPKRIRRRIVERSLLFGGSTPFPLPLAAAALESLRLLASDSSRCRRLRANADYLKAQIREGQPDIAEAPGPIVIVTLRSAADGPRLRRQLLAAGIYPPAGGYLEDRRRGAPERSLRFVISSEHTREELDALIAVVKSLKK